MSRSGALTIASLAVLALLVLLPRLVRSEACAWCAVPVVVGADSSCSGGCMRHGCRSTQRPCSSASAWPGCSATRWRAGEVPLVERLARVMHEADKVTPEIVAYARSVTVAWTLLMSAMGLLNLTLALIAAPDGVLLLMGIQPPFTVPVETWSLFANFLNYVIVGVFFIAEYIYRGYRFPEQRYRSLFDFLRRAAAVGPRVMRATTMTERQTSDVRRCRREHPSLPGHFPGSPVVPGVVVLDQVLKAAELWRHALGARQRAQAGEVSCAAAAGASGRMWRSKRKATALRFQVTRDGQLIAQGTFVTTRS